MSYSIFQLKPLMISHFEYLREEHFLNLLKLSAKGRHYRQLTHIIKATAVAVVLRNSNHFHYQTAKRSVCNPIFL